MDTDRVGRGRVDHTDRRSTWSVLAVAASVLAWVGGLLLHILGVLGPLVAVVGLIAGVVAALRERRREWQMGVLLATLANSIAVILYAIVLTSVLR